MPEWPIVSYCSGSMVSGGTNTLKVMHSFCFISSLFMKKMLIPSPNKEEYLKFLKNDPRSGKLWADHQDLQIVANAYQIKVHVLTVKVDSLDGPRARWTHLEPDSRIKPVIENV